MFLNIPTNELSFLVTQFSNFPLCKYNSVLESSSGPKVNSANS